MSENQKPTRSGHLLAGLVLSLVLTACGNGDAQTTTASEKGESASNQATNTNRPSRAIVFGVYATDKVSVVIKQFRPTLDVLQTRLSELLGENVTIRSEVAPTYRKGVSALVEGSVDFSRLGPASFVEATRDNPGLHLLAVETKKGKTTFSGVIAVHPKSEIKTIADLKGKRFAFGDEMSTIGRYLAQHELVKHGIFKRDLAGHEYLGRHDRVGIAVASREYDAGALKEGTFKKLVAKGRELRVLHRFDNVTKPWVARSKLDARVVAAMRKVFREFQGPVALKALGATGFVEGNTGLYQPIREAMESNDAFFDGKSSR